MSSPKNNCETPAQLLSKEPPPPLSQLVFQKYDTDKSGNIDLKEFRDMCYDMGHYLTRDEVEIAVRRLNTSGTGKITYEEFHKFWVNNQRFERLQLTQLELERFQAAIRFFRYYDADSSGSLSKEEFRAVHKVLVETSDANPDFDACFAELDTGGKGCVSFEDYIQWLGYAD